MRKYLLSLTMVLLGLLAGVSTMRAYHLNPPLSPAQAETLGFWARLTAKPAATTKGSGKVFVISEDDYTAAPAIGDYQAASSSYDGYSDIYVAASLINADVPFKIFAKANDGSYFTGWSFTEGYTDLMVMDNKVEVEPSSVIAHSNFREHTIYAAFEPIQLVSYTVDGDNDTYEDGEGHWVCEKYVTVIAKSPGIDTTFNSENPEDGVRHFKLPVITNKAGTAGTWTAGVTAWEEGTNIEMYGAQATLAIPVTFSVSSSAAAEYGAELVVETYAGVKMTIHLSARTPGDGSSEATRYNSAKVKQEAGDLADLLSHAAVGDIIKLNADYDNSVEIDKNIIFDLNGYTLDNTLTINGGEVTLAYSPYGGIVTGNVAVTVGKLTINGGRFDGAVNVSAGAELVQNGAMFYGELNNSGTTTITDGKYLSYVTSDGTLVVDGGFFYNDYEFSDPAITINGGTATIKRGIIGGDEATYGVNSYGLKTTGGTTTIEKGATIVGQEYAMWNAGGTLRVNGGKFEHPSTMVQGTISTFVSAYFKYNESEEDQAAVAALGKPVWRNTAGVEFREGYAFFVGDQAAAQAANVSVCRIGPVAYYSLEDALAYANNSGKDVIIIMENDYTLQAGYYTLPANATLVVPMSNEQDGANPIVPREDGSLVQAVSFRKLIFESGVNMTVQGTLELSGSQYGEYPSMGVPGSNYGHLIMKPGSHMTINDGGELRAWGYVSGDGTKDAAGNYLSGEIDARRGAIVREMFQMGDWKGGDISLTLVMPENPYLAHQQKTHLFPIYSYFIQNIESPVKYHPGSSLLCAASVTVAGISAYANSIKVVGKEGEAAMFLMDEMADAENTWVRKYYDAKNDKQVYEVNSGAQLGSVVIDLGEVPGTMFGGGGSTYKIQLDSRKFVLPLTNNFKIHLLSGSMQFTQSTACLPGMEVEVDKESEIAIVENEDDNIVDGALYFYDADQWSYKNKGYVGNSGHFGEIVRYSATWDLDPSKPSRPNVRDVSSPAAIGDAIMNVHGTFRMAENCAVYTSWAKDDSKLAINTSGTGGANIFSSNEDAGTFIFDDPAPAFDGITFTSGHEGEFNLDYMTIGQNCLINYDHNNHSEDGINYPMTENTVQKHEDSRTYGWELFTSAKLKNADGSFVSTEGTLGGKSYCFIDGVWTSMEVDGCFMVDAQDVHYAKPQEYVALTSTTPNADHTYSDKDGTGRLFILMTDEMGNCTEWWEVEKKDNLYHCIHPENDTYYYWDDGEGKWMEQRFTITWLNWDGTEIKSYIYDPVTGDPEEVAYSVTYGTQAEYLGSNPTREPNIDYTYDFTGWSPALGKVTSDVTYTATYSELPRKYTIVFTNEGGTEIERHFLTHNEMPVCENVPTQTGYTLQWEPAIAAVVGDATYRATWLPEPPTEYEVTFYDYNGTTVLKQSNVAVGSMPVAPAISDGKPAGSTGKPATTEFTYVFDHWSPALETVSATSIKSYTAVYREEAKEYTITFRNEDNSLIEERKFHYGETPVCSNTPTKANTPEWTYLLTWTPQIQTVMGDATYKADFETLKQKNKYSVTLQCSPSGAAVLSGGGLYEYNASATAITLTATPNTGFTFEGWSDGQEGTNTTRQMAVTEDIILVANFSVADPDYTITWKNWNGDLLKEVGQKANTATTYTGDLPTRPATSSETYTFDGWSTTLGGDKEYKNGLTPKATADATYYAHYAVEAIENLEVGYGAPVTLTAPVEYNDLVLRSNGVTSGQLFGADDFLTLTGHAYFELAVNATARLWYAFAVPWQVDAATGVSVNGHTLQLDNDFEIIYYDGERRALVGPQRTWNYVTNGEALQPGRLYMISLKSNATAIRFAKKAGVPYLTNTTSVKEYTSADPLDANWNGVANPALFHAYVNAGATLGQVYNSDSESYSPIVMSETKFVVGQAVFVQAPADKSIVVIPGASYARRRYIKAETTEETKYEVRIAPINTDYTDRVFIQMNEEKMPDIYTVGMDLQKMGVSSKVAQMWVDRYDTKLCLNTAAPVEGKADYPLGIFAPEAGAYQLGIKYAAKDNAQSDLYLTLDGEVIWNLSHNAYVVELEKGTNDRYGLRVSAKAPQETTDIDELIVDNKDKRAAKVLIDNHVYIIRDGKVYTITGQKVK